MTTRSTSPIFVDGARRRRSRRRQRRQRQAREICFHDLSPTAAHDRRTQSSSSTTTTTTINCARTQKVRRAASTIVAVPREPSGSRCRRCRYRRRRAHGRKSGSMALAASLPRCCALRATKCATRRLRPSSRSIPTSRRPCQLVKRRRAHRKIAGFSALSRSTAEFCLVNAAVDLQVLRACPPRRRAPD